MKRSKLSTKLNWLFGSKAGWTVSWLGDSPAVSECDTGQYITSPSERHYFYKHLNFWVCLSVHCLFVICVPQHLQQLSDQSLMTVSYFEDQSGRRRIRFLINTNPKEIHWMTSRATKKSEIELLKDPLLRISHPHLTIISRCNPHIFIKSLSGTYWGLC